MHQFEKMLRDSAGFGERFAFAHVQATSDIYHLPAASAFITSVAGNQKGEQHQTLTAEVGHQMRLNGSHNTVVVPVHQVPFLDCVNKGHSKFLIDNFSITQLYCEPGVCKTKVTQGNVWNCVRQS